MFILSGLRAIYVKVSRSEIWMMVSTPSSSVKVNVPSLLATIVVKVSRFLTKSVKFNCVIIPSSSV